MRNIWFTIYTGSTEKYDGIANYRTLMEVLMIPSIQDKINREKKIQKIMLMFSSEIDSDDIEHFTKLHFNKKITDGIVSLYVSTKNIGWNLLSDQQKKDFLIEKWKVLFNNLSDDYFVVDKSKVIDSLEKLRKEEWRQTSLLFKKKLKYHKQNYSIVMDISLEKTRLALVRESDEKWFTLKEYNETWKIMSDANFKNFKLYGDILTIENSAAFLDAEVFDLSKILLD